VVAISAFAGAASRRPGYDHVADTISKLSAQGVGQPWLWTAGLMAYAVLMALCAAGLRRRFGRHRPGRALGNAVAIHAVLMIGVAVFRDDLRPGGFSTLEGALHDILSGMAFSALIVAMVATVALAKVDRAMRSLRTATISIVAAMTIAGVTFLFTNPDVQGVPQRAFVALAALWIGLLASRSMGAVAETGSAGIDEIQRPSPTTT
jgi:hypothetical membrane protein